MFNNYLPSIGKGVAAGKFGDFDLTPIEQYVHPCKSEPRPVAGALDIGAFQWQPALTVLRAQ